MSPFLAGCMWLLVFQCIGEAVVQLAGLPVPGPVAGMALLFVALARRVAIPEGLAEAADGLTKHLSLLFVPAGVGVMLYVRQIASEWVPIAVAIIASTVLAIAVAAVVFQWLSRHRSGDPDAR